MILVIPLLVFSKVLTKTPRQLQCSAERNFSTTIFVEQFSMAAPTNKKSILIGTRSIQNSKRCFVNNENVKLVKAVVIKLIKPFFVKCCNLSL